MAALVVLLAAAAAARGELNGSAAVLLTAPVDSEAGQLPVEYLLLRNEFALSQSPSSLEAAVVEVTALQSDEKILSSYKLWVNGVPISNGPGRNVDCHGFSDPMAQHCTNASQGVDVLSVRHAINQTSVALALQGWSWGGGPPPRGHGRAGGIMLLLTLRYSDGSAQTVATTNREAGDDAAGSGGWLTYNATPAFNPGKGVGGMYFQPAENMLMAHYPQGWRLPGYQATASAGWLPAVPSETLGVSLRTPLAPKGSAAVVQELRPAAALTPIVPANCSGYRYLVDMGRELQGGLTLTINGTGFAGRSFRVWLGETLQTNGSVRWHMTAGCAYEETWTLADGLNVFDMGQEYKEWRWAELLELPAPIGKHRRLPTPLRAGLGAPLRPAALQSCRRSARGLSATHSRLRTQPSTCLSPRRRLALGTVLLAWRRFRLRTMR